MKKNYAVLLGLALLMTPLVHAEDFDQDASAVLKIAKANVAEDKKPIPARGAWSGQYIPACKDIVFKSDSPESQVKSLVSYGETCIPGDPTRGGDRCNTPPTVFQDIQITLQNRKPLQAGQTETFEVCLTGTWATWYPRRTVYKYKQVAEKTHRDSTEFVIAPADKISK